MTCLAVFSSVTMSPRVYKSFNSVCTCSGENEANSPRVADVPAVTHVTNTSSIVTTTTIRSMVSVHSCSQTANEGRNDASHWQALIHGVSVSIR